MLPLYKRALAIDEKALGEDHPSTLLTVSNLAKVIDALGRPDEADQLATWSKGSGQAARRRARKSGGVEWHGPSCPMCAWSTSGSRSGADTANCCHLGGGWEGRLLHVEDAQTE